jgi:hypothetical protein
MFYEELIVLEVQTKAVAPNEGKIIDRNRCCRRNHFEEKLTSQIKKLHHPQNGSDSKSMNSTLL